MDIRRGSPLSAITDKEQLISLLWAEAQRSWNVCTISICRLFSTTSTEKVVCCRGGIVFPSSRKICIQMFVVVEL
jgi:putative Ca2+/H+ antiporter (TMEM165/GDT1 family)